MPHPVRGTVSSVERHMARARNHIHVWKRTWRC
ncbi:hypothetical protein ACLK1T_11700 [Escherichia coli]